MWLMTPDGFLSVVAKGGPGVLMIRARDYDSLSSFLVAVQGDISRITEGEGTDYPFRIVSSKAEVSEFMMQMVDQIDYSNFKTEAKRVRGKTFADFLSKVWVAGLMLTPFEVQAREDARIRALNPHYATNGGSEWGGALAGYTYTGKCDRCGKKLRKCKCTDEELDCFYADDLDRVKDVASMTDAEFAAYEALTS